MNWTKLTSRNGNNGVGDLVSEVSFGSLLHLGQDHSGDFLGGLLDISCRQLEKVDRK
jgi:hypothetical protein